jgi:hypothetical protein
VYGVHVARARAAGIHVPHDDRDHVKPRTNGQAAKLVARRLATVQGQARLVTRRCFAVLPWEQLLCDACGRGRVCTTCKGRGYRVTQLAPLPALEGVDTPRDALEVTVPLAHAARWGHRIKLSRTEAKLASVGVVWLYRPKEGPET